MIDWASSSITFKIIDVFEPLHVKLRLYKAGLFITQITIVYNGMWSMQYQAANWMQPWIRRKKNRFFTGCAEKLA